MPTTLYLRNSDEPTTRWSNGESYSLLAGGTSAWRRRPLLETAGTASTYPAAGENLVTGPTAGVELGGTGGATNTAPPVWMWVSPVIASSVTISGSITINISAYETNAAANASINVRLLKINGQTGAITEFAKSTRTTELGTAYAIANFTVSPTSTSFVSGDRIALVPFADDSTSNMVSGAGLYRVHVRFDGAAGSGADSYITFTETISFGSLGNTFFFITQNASDVVPASGVAYEAWTSRGSGTATAVTNTVAGPTSPVQITGTAGGSNVAWYTRRLESVTLSGAWLFQIWGYQSNTAANAIWGVEIAVCDADGSNPVVWAKNTLPDSMGTTVSGWNCHIGGPETVVQSGQRLRIRVFIDDHYGSSGTSQNMASGHTATLQYNSTSSGTGDFLFQANVSLVEYAGDAMMAPYIGGGYY